MALEKSPGQDGPARGKRVARQDSGGWIMAKKKKKAVKKKATKKKKK